MKEEWKPLPFANPGFKKYEYEISNFGRIKGSGALLKTFVVSGRYSYINLYFDKGKFLSYGVHYLVLRTFADPPKEQQIEPNHKDGNRQNNCISNLEWTSRSENAKHAWRTGLQVVGHGGKLKPGEVWLIRRLAGKISQWKIGAMFKLSQSMISRIASCETYTEDTSKHFMSMR